MSTFCTQSEVKEITKFEDILDLVGTNGWKNALIYLLISSCGTILALHTLSYQFLGATPNHWCHVDELSKANWTDSQIKEVSLPYSFNLRGEKEYSKCEMKNLNYEEISTMNYDDIISDNSIINVNGTVKCKSIRFDEDYDTIVTQWDLVCDRRALYSTTQSAVMIGFLIGSFWGGYLIDKFGRAFMYKIFTVLYILFGYFTIISQSIQVFIFMRIIASLLNFGIYLAGFILTMEICSTKQRSLVINFFMIPWSVGIMLTPAIAYFVRPWKSLQIALVSPALLLLINLFLLPESPRWLIMNQRFEDALKILVSLAKANKRTLPSDDKMISYMTMIYEQNTPIKDTVKESCLLKFKKSILHIFSMVINKKFRILTLTVFFCWLAAALVYYGVSVSHSAISISDYLYIFLGGAIELPVFVILWPLTSYFGRKITAIAFFLLTALSILSVMTLILISGKDSYPYITLAMFLVGKFAITAAFHMLWVSTGELYPTTVRSLILGEASMLARIGSGASPYVNDLLGSVAVWAPSALFGGISLLAGLAAIVIPETAKKDLRDSV